MQLFSSVLTGKWQSFHPRHQLFQAYSGLHQSNLNVPSYILCRKKKYLVAGKNLPQSLNILFILHCHASGLSCLCRPTDLLVSWVAVVNCENATSEMNRQPPMHAQCNWWQNRKLSKRKRNTKYAPAAVAQSVKRPDLRSLKEVQWSWHEFDSRSQHRS